jgi:hypothetical protein
MSAAFKLFFLNIWLLIIEDLDIFNDSNCGNQQFFPFHSFQLPLQNSLELCYLFESCIWFIETEACFMEKYRLQTVWEERKFEELKNCGVFCSEPHSQDKTCAWPSRFAS